MNKCKVCNSEVNNVSYIGIERMFGFGDEFPYFKCSKCGCLQIETIPEDMNRYYPENYYSYSIRKRPNTIKSKIADYLLKGAIANRLGYKNIVGQLAMIYNSYYRKQLFYLNYIEKGFNARVMDVGCGAGELLNYMQTIGFTNLTGIDPYLKEDIHYANGVNIYKKYISEVEEVYDFIMLHHSFEHMTEPNEVFSSLHKILSNEGMVIIRIPIVDGYAWRRYGMKWFQVDAPRHFFLHTVNSISLLAKSSGFEIVRIEYDSEASQILFSEKYLQDIPLSMDFNFPDDFIKRAKDKAKELNRERDGDQACFYLRKATCRKYATQY